MSDDNSSYKDIKPVLISYNIPILFGRLHITKNEYGLPTCPYSLNDFCIFPKNREIWSLEESQEAYPLLNIGFQIINPPELIWISKESSEEPPDKDLLVENRSPESRVIRTIIKKCETL